MGCSLTPGRVGESRNCRVSEVKTTAVVGEEVDPQRAAYVDKLLAKYRAGRASGIAEPREVPGEEISSIASEESK